MKTITLSLLIAAFSVLSLSETRAAQETDQSVSLEVTPTYIPIRAFYRGTDLQVRGEFPLCDAVLLELRGEEKTETLNLKGRVAVLWMNVAEITVEHAPQLFILRTSNDFNRYVSMDTLASLGIGLAALKSTLSFSSDTPLPEGIFDEYIKLKSSGGTYQIQENSLQILASGNDRETFSTTLPLPATAKEGTYQLSLYCFHGGSLVGESSAQVTIEKTGFPLFITNLAFAHPALYGIVAILVAMLAGILMGLIFSRGKGAH